MHRVPKECPLTANSFSNLSPHSFDITQLAAIDLLQVVSFYFFTFFHQPHHALAVRAVEHTVCVE